ncbi:hypothetical protein [Amycolatopsis sp. La24]|uniref:GNAT family N-acetyltransferase n=1 Tax=Amycolatopsis sp. La24 TaxID=3028304 RepID=UPI0023B1C366|nr:hypothetical protein [Amycolatopsis sp. La24]
MTGRGQRFLFRVHQAALGEHVAAIWGWDDENQRRYHDRAFSPRMWQMITVDGAGLLRWLIDVAAERKQPLVLEVLEVNPRAHAFYLRHGFRETGRRGRKILLARHPDQED